MSTHVRVSFIFQLFQHHFVLAKLATAHKQLRDRVMIRFSRTTIWKKNSYELLIIKVDKREQEVGDMDRDGHWEFIVWKGGGGVDGQVGNDDFLTLIPTK